MLHKEVFTIHSQISVSIQKNHLTKYQLKKWRIKQQAEHKF